MADSKQPIGIKSVAPAITTPPPIAQAKKQTFETVHVKVPVRFAWSPGQKLPPSAQPLKGLVGQNDHIASITVDETHSNAPNALFPVFEGLEPTPVDKDPHKLHIIQRPPTAGVASGASFIVHPDTHQVNKKIYQNPNQPSFHQPTNPSTGPAPSAAKLREKTIDIGDKAVLVNSEQSPELYTLLKEKMKLLGSNATTTSSAISGKSIEVKKAELGTFLEEYQKKIDGNVPDVVHTIPTEHKLVLKTWENGEHFGTEVAESAVHADLRNDLLAKDTKHTVTTVLDYEIVRPVATK